MRLVFATALLAAATLGQTDPDFTSADKYLLEQSYARACDGFGAFLKAHPESPLAREAQAKRAAACLRVGRGNTYNELLTMATKGEKDFARAYAMWALAERGERNFDEALVLLKQAASGDDRQAQQAKSLFIAGAVRSMENESYNQKKVEQLAAQALELAGPADAAHVRLLRARSHAQQQKTQAQAEEELLAVGKTETPWADNGLFDCARLREGQERYDAALELYDEIVRRFSRSTSDVWESAKAQAAEIRRPWVELSIGTVELPGVKPIVNWSARNVADDQLRWQVEKIDPMAQEPRAAFSGDHGTEALHGPVVSQWKAAVKPKTNHAQVGGNFDLAVADKGAYVVQVSDAAGHRARAFALVTTHVTVVKAGSGQAVVWVVDAMTGRAVKDAQVRLFQSSGYDDYRKYDGVTDATGLARFELTAPHDSSPSLIAFAKADGSYSYSNGYATWAGAAEREELLAWGVTDRPLYKPGEKVGLKMFLRSRSAGPSVPVAKEEVRLSVRDPQGREVAKPSLTSSAFGTVSFDFTLPKNAPLGQWAFYVEDSRRSFNQSSNVFRVEEYKPPEYTVRVTPASKPTPGGAFKVKVAASFFFGGPVANAKGRALVNVTAWQHQWGRWPDEAEEQPGYGYGYDDEYGYRGRYYGGYGGYWFNANHTLPFKTGADGTAEIEIPAEKVPEGLTGLQYQITALVTDASRREVSGQASLHVAKDPYFVDARTDRFLYKPGEKVRVELRAEDANGEPQSPSLSVRLVKLGEGDKVEATISQAKVTMKGGHAEVTLDPDALGPVRVQVFDASDAKQERALASTDLWLTNEAKPIIPKEPGFHVYTDKGPLKAGQSLRALVVSSSPGGHALVSLETERIVAAQSVELLGRARFVELKLTPDLVPNAWLVVWRIEQLTQQQQERPIQVRGDSSEVDVAVRFDQPVTEPGEKVGATVTAAGLPRALPTETAVTFVDEALLALAPERSDFLSWFGRRPRQHYVQTQSSLSQRSYRGPPQKQQEMAQAQKRPSPDAPADKSLDDAFGAAAGPAKAASGMDLGRAKEKKDSAGKAEPPPPPASAPRPSEQPGREAQRDGSAPPKVRTDFGSSAGWFPELSGNGEKPGHVTAALTDSLTTWRATAYLVTPTEKLGVGHGTVRASKPLMVRLEAPRFFTERDEVTLSAIATSRLGSPVDAEVSLEVGPQLKALGPTHTRLHLEAGADARFDVRFKVVEPGTVKLRAVAKGAGKGDAMEWSLPVVVHGSAQRQYFAGRLEDKVSFDFELPEKRKPQLTRLELQLSPSVLSVVFDSLPYLAEYPYGCVEQTLSRFVPATIAAKAVKDFHLSKDRVPPDLDDKVQAGLKRLYDFQHGDGGWGWWKEDPTNRWMSAYVVYGLSLAKEAGVQVDSGVLERGRSYLKNGLGAALVDPDTHVFMDLALAKSGAAFRPGLDADFAARGRLSPKGKALLALALQAAGDKRERVAVENLDDVVKAAAARADASVGDANDAWSTSAAIESTSYVLMAMAHHDLQSPALKPLTDFLMLRRNGGKWRSTRDTAFAVYALADLAKAEGQSARAGSFVVRVNGREVKRFTFARGGVGLPSLVLDDAALKPGKNRVEISRDSSGTGYWAATYDVYNQNDFIKGVGGDVKVKRTYTLLGKPSTQPGSAETEYGMPVDSGARVRVDLEVTANKAVEYVMVEDLKPAGFEAVEQESGPKVCNYQCAHAELRTDRVAMFLDQVPVGTTKLSYELRAEVPGRFNALPARFEAMYAPEIQATADEMRFEVRDEASAGVARP